MLSLKDFMEISRVPGVDQYILVDHTGKIFAHDIKNPERAAELVFTCGRDSLVIGKTRFKHLVFSRNNQKNLFIFPVGNYYLGVVKLKDINNISLADNITRFLDGLLKKG